MTVTSTSERLTPFLGGHEGFEPRTYRCPAGVLTIGFGFTMGSKVFAEYWLKTRGHALRIGDTITRSEAEMLMTKMLAVEYSPPVAKALPNPTQHAFDGSTSVSWNCGPGSLKWKWAIALGKGEVKLAASLLRTTAVTANGRRLAGLVRRRKEEAALIERGDYGYSITVSAESIGFDDVKQYQGWLATLGFYKGSIDGKRGELTIGAVKNFQRAHGLDVDGKVGPASRAAMIRALDARLTTKGTATAGGGGLATGAGTSAPSAPPAADVAPIPDTSGLPDLTAGTDALFWTFGTGLTCALIVFAAFILWRNRGRFTNRRVPT